MNARAFASGKRRRAGRRRRVAENEDAAVAGRVLRDCPGRTPGGRWRGVASLLRLFFLVAAEDAADALGEGFRDIAHGLGGLAGAFVEEVDALFAE